MNPLLEALLREEWPLVDVIDWLDGHKRRLRVSARGAGDAGLHPFAVPGSIGQTRECPENAKRVRDAQWDKMLCDTAERHKEGFDAKLKAEENDGSSGIGLEDDISEGTVRSNFEADLLEFVRLQAEPILKMASRTGKKSSIEVHSEGYQKEEYHEETNTEENEKKAEGRTVQTHPNLTGSGRESTCKYANIQKPKSKPGAQQKYGANWNDDVRLQVATKRLDLDSEVDFPRMGLNDLKLKTPESLVRWPKGLSATSNEKIIADQRCKKLNEDRALNMDANSLGLCSLYGTPKSTSSGNPCSSKSTTQRRRIQPTSVDSLQISEHFASTLIVQKNQNKNGNETVPGSSSLNQNGFPRLENRFQEFSNGRLPGTINEDVREAKKYSINLQMSKHDNIEETVPSKIGLDRELDQQNSMDMTCQEGPDSAFANTEQDSNLSGPRCGNNSHTISFRPLNDCGRNLALIHAHIVKQSANISVSDELEFILSLLSVPLSIELTTNHECTDIAKEDGEYPADFYLIGEKNKCGILVNGFQARQYAFLILCHCGTLLRSLETGVLVAIEFKISETLRALAFKPKPIRKSDHEKSTHESREHAHYMFETLQKNKAEIDNYQCLVKECFSDGQYMKDLQSLRVIAASNLKYLRSRKVRTDMAFNSVKFSDGIAAGLLGLGVFTSDGKTSRPADEQRRIKNRETVRDAWYDLMKLTSKHMSGFGLNFGCNYDDNNLNLCMSPDSRVSNIASGDKKTDAEIFFTLQEQANELLRNLMPTNFEYFSELFVAAVLQAAATGDAFMDEYSNQMLEKLASQGGISRLMALVKRMPSQFSGQEEEHANSQPPTFAINGFNNQNSKNNKSSSYNVISGKEKRVNGGSNSRDLGQNGTCVQTNLSHPQPGVQTHRFKSPKKYHRCHNSSNRDQQQRYNRHTQPTWTSHFKHGKRSATRFGAADEASICAAGFAAEFPVSLRLYVIFLEAADSNRLNINVGRVIARRLHELVNGNDYAKLLSPGPGMTEKTIAVTTLASFLGYLSFTCDRSDSSDLIHTDNVDAIGPWSSFSVGEGCVLDVAEDLEKAKASGESMVSAIPWATRYLKFLRWNPRAKVLPYFQKALGCISELRSKRELSPSSEHFGITSLCLRSLLDDTATALELPGQNSVQEECNQIYSILDNADCWVDSRFIELCCPLLARTSKFISITSTNTSRSFHHDNSNQPESSTSNGIHVTSASKRRTVRPNNLRLHQNEKITTTLQRSKPADSNKNEIKARLQRTFLEQYSRRPDQVKLKEVVEFTADIIGHNAVTTCISCYVPDAVESSATRILDDLLSVSLEIGSNISTDRKVLENYARKCLEKEKVIAVEDVIEKSNPKAKMFIPKQAVRAMAALTSEDVGIVVIETAAAIVAEVALISFERRLHPMAADVIESALEEKARKVTSDIVKMRKLG